MAAGDAFLLVETAAALFMSGVLWTMQLLNYPLLALVGREAFTGYETAGTVSSPDAVSSADWARCWMRTGSRTASG